MREKTRYLKARLTETQYRQLESIAEKKEMSLSDVAREAVDSYNQMDRVEQRLNKLEAVLKVELKSDLDNLKSGLTASIVSEISKSIEVYDGLKDALLEMYKRGSAITPPNPPKQ